MRTVFFVLLTAIALGWLTKFSMMLIGSPTAARMERTINSTPESLDREIDLLQDVHEHIIHDY